MAAAKAIPTSGDPSSSSIYDALAGLKFDLNETVEVFENVGDFGELRDALGAVRDRANAIQDVAIGFIATINENL